MGTAYTQERNEAIFALYRETKNMQIVGEQFGLTWQAVWSLLTRYKIPVENGRSIAKAMRQKYPKPAVSRRMTYADRFWSRVDQRANDECWLWTASIFPSTGYGKFHKEHKNIGVYAHRLSWAFFTGQEVPDGLCILHKCGIRRCCNPHHLYAGTPKENARDRDRHKIVGHGPHSVVQEKFIDTTTVIG